MLSNSRSQTVSLGPSEFARRFYPVTVSAPKKAKELGHVLSTLWRIRSLPLLDEPACLIFLLKRTIRISETKKPSLMRSGRFGIFLPSTQLPLASEEFYSISQYHQYRQNHLESGTFVVNNLNIQIGRPQTQRISASLVVGVTIIRRDGTVPESTPQESFSRGGIAWIFTPTTSMITLIVDAASLYHIGQWYSCQMTAGSGTD
ncbi:hypothetical protein ASPWEDRAFT_598648 [Aspergillus wentii DTO 134E9]|uniref:Uncharacterized protein n=1 Tax=Aspergillus wentii DTO 134E9 TaxID=1073089 RepID=A0A1L9RDI7_ASPWE|nr:uncharacterized protein ASPWEDRAFT_598648 [Aspergillus wentii DTO 134E9]OJJ32948.1 hypothetical protein ASPWEDRAFT_598648 [Aspergillus wentii DTO 134E9]